MEDVSFLFVKRKVIQDNKIIKIKISIPLRKISNKINLNKMVSIKYPHLLAGKGPKWLEACFYFLSINIYQLIQKVNNILQRNNNHKNEKRFEKRWKIVYNSIRDKR